MSGQRPARPSPGRDRGSATIWAVAGIAVLCLIAAVTLTYGSVVQTRHRATAASDLAALAGAVYAPYGAAEACAKARWVADGMRVRVTSCRLSGWDVLIEVSAALPDGLDRFGLVTAHSRAGPALRAGLSNSNAAPPNSGAGPVDGGS
jgi:secretion/DNA translocation related TadE-like protein